MPSVAAREARRPLAVALLGAVALGLFSGNSVSFVAPPQQERAAEEASGRRELLAWTALGLAASPVAPAVAVETGYGFFDKLPGPFEVDPKEVVVTGDAKNPDIVKARKLLVTLQAQATDALKKLEADNQADVMDMVEPFGLAEIAPAHDPGEVPVRG